MYLMIENRGVAPSEGFTMIGVSTTRNAGVSGTIGKFGSGTKFAINYFLRNNIDFVVFCGGLRIAFETEALTVNDNLREETFRQVVVKLDCSDPRNQIHRKEKLSWTTEHGLDWTLPMAMRELIANALDRTTREGLTAKDMTVKIVEDNQVRAAHKDKATKICNHTRIFVKYTPEVAQYHASIAKRFLHFEEADNMKKSTVMYKDDREVSKSGVKPAVIYKEGVFVREFTKEHPALFDYNFNELPLDESRVADPYAITSHISAYLALEADDRKRAKILAALVKGEKYLETECLSEYQMEYAASRPDAKKYWQQTWKTLGEHAVLLTCPVQMVEYIKKKGYTPIKIQQSAWHEFLLKCGVPTDVGILTQTERDGIVELPATKEVLGALQQVWDFLESHNMLNGRSLPDAKCFNKIMDGESLLLGYYNKDTVYIHESISDGTSSMLLETMLEEVVHHVTGAGDLSRDLQDFLFKLLVKANF